MTGPINCDSAAAYRAAVQDRIRELGGEATKEGRAEAMAAALTEYLYKEARSGSSMAEIGHLAGYLMAHVAATVVKNMTNAGISETDASPVVLDPFVSYFNDFIADDGTMFQFTNNMKVSK